ncbi:UNVERIFIED_CONTAM: hypothetical protein GTU68_026169 [Idotea baltica]|nr:hypothetical protein [Idotea baltica]
MKAQVKFFTGSATQYLSDRISEEYGQELGKIRVERFSDGEIQPILLDSVRGCFTFFIQSTFSPAENFLELCMMMDAAKRASADYIVAVIPYFGYARQDRKDKPRVSIASKLMANILATAGANRVMTMDLHAPQIQGFFDIPVDHLESSTIFVPYIKKLDIDPERLMFAAPDVGSSKRVRAFAKHFSADMVICDKYRVRANEIAEMSLIGDVADRDVIIIDDIIDTANTLVNAADLIIEKGARSVRAMCTHPVMSGQAYEKIEKSKLTELVVCDTIPLQKTTRKIKVLSVASLFATAFKYIHEHQSISSLFVQENI